MLQPDEIIRSNRKTLSVCIDCFGKLTVRAPRRCDDERIFAFLREKEAWILRQKAKTAGAGIDLPPENLNGYSLSLLGEKHRVLLIGGDYIRFDPETKQIFLPEKNARQRLVKWLKENAKRIFLEQTCRRAKEMQTSFQSVSVSSARSKWGCCTFDNRIRYSFRLLYAPKEVIDYVIVHELAHTKQKNHSPAFWREVEKFVPDYKRKRKWLKDHAILMHIF
ncbi:MAG: M48 family metallopeptidase [Clostridia bacterium]|nr:M48 family metallopeptidase [Clostridia bacterium]